MSEERKISLLDELEAAIEMIDTPEDCQAYVSKRTGEVVFDAEVLSGEPCPVDDIENHEDFLAVPDKHELDLGTRLVWKFVRMEIPGLEPKIREMFSRRGAYGRWKDWLHANDLLEKWYEFENESTRQALLDWCRENGIPIQKPDAEA